MIELFIIIIVLNSLIVKFFKINFRCFALQIIPSVTCVFLRISPHSGQSYRTANSYPCRAHTQKKSPFYEGSLNLSNLKVIWAILSNTLFSDYANLRYINDLIFLESGLI